MQYSILLHVLLTSPPSIDLPLLTLPARDEAIPEIVLTTKMRVQPRLGGKDGKDLEPDKEAAKGSLSVESEQWELVTVTVDCLYGKLAIYLNGELHMQVHDPETLNLSSPFAPEQR